MSELDRWLFAPWCCGFSRLQFATIAMSLASIGISICSGVR